MFQLKFTDDFTQIIRNIPFWKMQDNISNYITKFITDTSDMRVIYESNTQKFYCGKCTEELDENNYCIKCHLQHRNYTLRDIQNNHIDIHIVNKKLASKIYTLNDTCCYFIFDIVGENIYLYLIREEITYDNPLSLIPYKNSKLYIDISKSYFIEKDGITNLDTNTYISFQSLADYSQKLETDNDSRLDNEESSDLFKIYEEFQLMNYEAYLYTDNLLNLKNTIYKYSKIWELGDYLKEIHEFNISQFTFYPLYYNQFEYLVNYKLYNLAWNVPNWFKQGENFRTIFGVDRKFLPFMVRNNIHYKEFKLLQLYPTDDIEVLKFFRGYCWDSALSNLVKDVKVDLRKLRDYLVSMGLSSHYVGDYLDYIGMARQLNLNLGDKSVLFPNDFREAHDKLYSQIEIVKDPFIDKKIKELSYMLELNRYEDDDYIIYPATSIRDLVDESRQQKNCVRTYCELMADNKSQIYFMRKKTELGKSLVTIEVKGTTIVQARIKYNQLPSKELEQVLHKWEQSLISITNE